MPSPISKKYLFLLTALLLTNLMLPPNAALAQEPSIHPTFPLLDEAGLNVLDSGQPVSTMNTCGSCHDANYIQSHSFHTEVGLNSITEPGQAASGRSWDISPGWFGRWNALTYRYLTPQGDELLDMGTADWIREYGPRHVGGGPAVYSRTGQRLTELPITPNDPETHSLNPETGEVEAWDWQKSGVVEMNCFLCHLPNPNNDARIEQLQAGNFGWANTATLLNTGLVEKQGDAWRWNPDAFTTDGSLAKEYVTLQDPNNTNCGACHGLVHVKESQPLATTGCLPDQWNTETTGQIISPQKMSVSDMNLAGKQDLSRTWDVHATRVLECVDCHYSMNNPIYYQESDATRPEHLTFDARRLDFSEYLLQPSHEFAKGQSVQNTLAPALNDSMRRCESCHSIEATHDWLPYKERHMAAISCESCHIPKMYSPARQSYDWTVMNPSGEPQIGCRGIEGEKGTFNALITGYEPILLPRQEVDGDTKLAPHNLISAWFWVHGNPERPVRLHDLQTAYFADDQNTYHPDVLTALDTNHSGDIEQAELRLDTPAKVAAIQTRLESLGLQNLRIAAEIQPYSISHNVTNGEWVTKDCQACHSEDSILTRPLQLASYLPGEVMPEFVADAPLTLGGEMNLNADGALFYQPNTSAEGLYVLGYDNVAWIDWVGIAAFIGTLLGVFVHGGLRFVASLRMPHHEPQLKRVYMYTVYERLWHWLQTAAILALIFTGLIIHRPDTFGIFDFGYTVIVHNVLGFILLINAFLAAFYHLVSGEIQQYLPQPRGFFNQAITQTTFYVQGIFKGKEHPFEKNPQRKLNPLQQITYFGILNVLLPLQIITGIMIWGAQRWPAIAAAMGGLPFLAPFHTLIAWLFAAFVVMHVYLTTTAHTPLAGIRAMIIGWDEVEVHGEV